MYETHARRFLYISRKQSLEVPLMVLTIRYPIKCVYIRVVSWRVTEVPHIGLLKEGDERSKNDKR